MNIKIAIFWVFIFFGSGSLSSQSYLTPSDTLNKKRFNTALGFTAATYATFSVILYNTWYKKFDRSSFHFFNDVDEWKQMDKIGHTHTAYFQSALWYKGAKWTGLNEKKSIFTGMICGTLFQSTLEVMDGFSSKWGFSIPDMAANIAGVSGFALQQHYWQDQRITLKVSSIPVSYSSDPILSESTSSTSSLSTRADQLFGANYFESFLKDYNAQTYWASVNVHSFLQKGNKWPVWLNIAVGYGAENMFGGFENRWSEDGQNFIADNLIYPRYRQFYIGLDVDLPKIKPKNPFLKTIFSIINIFKIPSPALEINTQGIVVFHLLR
ncbi:MAG: DUF2279 domain-containing protein [Saprospiraceae bacterium]